MDPEGIRQIFFAECSDAPHFGIREALDTLPFPNRRYESYFFGVHLPLTFPLPKRLDTTLQQTVGLHLHDAVILSDIDPIVFDADDLLNLQAYVEAGGGLLVLPGPHSFSQAQRNWGPLRETLPGAIELRTQRRSKLWNDPFPAESLPDPADVTTGDPHPVTRGLTGTLGRVRRLEPVTATPGASVLLRAGQRSVALARPYGRGRVVMVCAYPGDEQPSLFAAPAWQDVLRQAVAWLMRRDADLIVTASNLEHHEMCPGEQRAMRVQLLETASGPVHARVELARADPGWLAVGREPQYGEATVVSLSVGGTPSPASASQELRSRSQGTATLPSAQGGMTSPASAVEYTLCPSSPGLWRLRFVLEGPDWATTRMVEVPVRTPTNLRLWSESGEYVVTPGTTLPLQLGADTAVQANVRIVDADSQEVWRREAVPTGPLSVEIGLWEIGDYEVIARAGDDEARLRFAVCEPLVEIPFGLSGVLGGTTEERVRWWHDHFRRRGFNSFHCGLPAAAPGPVTGFRSGPYGRYLAQSGGAYLWSFEVAHLISTHGHYGAEGSKPTRPCVLSPEYDAALKHVLEDRFRRGSAAPRLAGIEILDEPHVLRANVCRCELCQAEFQRRHGYPLPTWDDALAAKDGRTRDYFEWTIDYVREAFRRGHATWKSFGPGPRLFHVLCAIGSGSISAAHGVAEDLPWSPYADILTFDCYNYMYPLWRGSQQLMWNQFHYLAGHFRFLALRNKQPLGFWIQVTDRDIPVRPADPLRAPSETLYTAIGAGAKTFHLMAKGSYTNTQNCREEKFEVFARDIQKVNQVAPLLERAHRPRSRIAMVFPFHDRLYRYPTPWLPPGHTGLGFYTREWYPIDTTWPNHNAPVNVAELLVRAFGETDVIDQRALRDGALDEYDGFVLAGVDWIDERDAAAVRAFVERGGALIADHVPSRNLDGQPLDLLAPLFGKTAEHFYRATTISHGAFGKGRSLLVSDDLNELYTGCVERDDPILRGRLENLVRRFFFDAGLRPYAGSSDPEIEASLLLTPDTMVVVGVNHAGTRRQSRVMLYRPPVAARYAFDLVTMQPLPIVPVDEGIALDLDLDEREGIIIGLYAAVPEQIALKPAAPALRRGERFAVEVLLTDAAGSPVRGDHLVDVQVQDPRGAVHRLYSGLRCARNGQLILDAPLAVNARVGEWTVTAFDRFTTRQVRGTVSVR
ncbi:hypothetical protein HQ590_07930 [bacterium]|nr:hypothetical protein [bacterium]